MNTSYNDRCAILAKWLGIRERIGHIKNIYQGMLSTHTAYKHYQDLIEFERAELVRIQRENPWLDGVLAALSKDTEA